VMCCQPPLSVRHLPTAPAGHGQLNELGWLLSER
jgi:hypothetical protein